MDDPRDTRPVAPAGRGQILQFPKSSAGRAVDEGDASSLGKTNGIQHVSGAELFALLWQALADVLGTAGAATLLRRAAQRRAPACPELTALSIKREGLDHQYHVPNSWNVLAPEPPPALHALVRELWVLLVELTGSVIVTRLAQVSALRDCGLVPPRTEQP